MSKSGPKGFTNEQIFAAIEQAGSQAGAAKLLGVNQRSLERRVRNYRDGKTAEQLSDLSDGVQKLPYEDRMELARQRDDIDPGMLDAVEEARLSLDSARHGWRRMPRDDGGFDSVFWKQNQDEDSLQKKADAILAALLENIEPVSPLPMPKLGREDLLNLYVFTDGHIGMLAWHEETDSDWDTTIAENVIVRWFAEAIKRAPDANRAVLAEIGDLLHADSLEALTPASKNVLDADSRYQKVVRVVIRILRQIIAMLLEKYQQVDVIICEGNHNPSGAVWCREFLAALYEAEPRLRVDRSPKPFYCIEHGQTSLFFHHGHQVRMAELDRVMASEFREVFGRTKYSFAHMGHFHHREKDKESQLMVVEQHRTLASRDAHSARHGYNAGKDACCITYHRDHGDCGRVVISRTQIEQLES